MLKKAVGILLVLLLCAAVGAIALTLYDIEGIFSMSSGTAIALGVALLAGVALAVQAYFIFAIWVPSETMIVKEAEGEAVGIWREGRSFRIPWLHRQGAIYSLTKERVPFDQDVEAKNEDSVPFKCALHYHASVTHWRAFHNTVKGDDGRGKLHTMLTDAFQSFLSVLGRESENRKALQKDFNKVASQATRAFREGGFEEHYGIVLDAFKITDPGQPEILKQAELKKEAQKEENEARVIEWQQFDAIAKKKVNYFNRRRKAEQKARGEEPTGLTAEEAQKIYDQVFHDLKLKYFEDVKETHARYGIDKQTLQDVRPVIQLIAALIGKKEKDNE